MEEFDIGPDLGQDQLAQLRNKIGEMIDQQALVDDLEEQVKQAKEHLHALRTRHVPDLMAEMQVDQMRFRGYDISVADLVSGSLPKEESARQRAIEWLEAHEAGGLIKTDLQLSFGKGQEQEASKLYSELAEMGYPVFANRNVHPQTLMAWARQQLAEGEPLDPEVLGLYVGKVAKLKVVK